MAIENDKMHWVCSDSRELFQEDCNWPVQDVLPESQPSFRGTDEINEFPDNVRPVAGFMPQLEQTAGQHLPLQRHGLPIGIFDLPATAFGEGKTRARRATPSLSDIPLRLGRFAGKT